EAAQPEEVPSRRTRTVVDRRSPSQRPATSVSRPAPARPGAVATAPPVVPEGQRERLVSDAEQAQRLIEAQARRYERPSRPAATAPDPAPVEPEEAEWSPDRAEHLEVWELPLSVRRELPDLNLSIHVFSAEPAERFVLINGERRAEGADLGEGARLAEITRLGAVVDFRDYRFLLKP
ncbi:MAG: general secretion pathway protein GspB, partial [Wenzhouxiangella sp.]